MKKLVYLLPLLLFLLGNNRIHIDSSKEGKSKKILDTVKEKVVVEEKKESLEMYHKSAHASYYADKFTGRRTASGTVFHNWDMTCAHRKLPFGTKLKVTCVKNGKFCYVTVTDRGPFIKNKHIDLSKKAFMDIATKSWGGYLEVDLEIVKKK